MLNSSASTTGLAAPEPVAPRLETPHLTAQALPPPMDAALVRRHAAAARIPCDDPDALRRAQPPRHGRFDPAQAADRLLAHPALLIAAYAHAARAGARDLGSDPAELAERLGAAGLADALDRLAATPAPKADDTQPALAAACRRAAAAAALAAGVAPSVGIGRPRTAAATLLHDAGRLALLASPIGAQALALTRFAQEAALPVGYIEHCTFGVSHAALGAELCQRWRVPPAVALGCTTHEHVAAQRARLDAADRPLAALVAACVALVDAVAIDAAAEDPLRHLPPELAAALEPHLHDAELQARQRLAPAAPAAESLQDTRIAVASPAGRWSPFATALRSRGAAVSSHDAATPFAPAPGLAILVIDATDAPLTPTLPRVAALAREAGRTPSIVLADRCYDPEDRLPDATPAAAWLATPIRANRLTDAVAAVIRDPHREAVAGVVGPASPSVRQASA